MKLSPAQDRVLRDMWMGKTWELMLVGHTEKRLSARKYRRDTWFRSSQNFNTISALMRKGLLKRGLMIIHCDGEDLYAEQYYVYAFTEEGIAECRWRAQHEWGGR